LGKYRSLLLPFAQISKSDPFGQVSSQNFRHSGSVAPSGR
jgi:hypothetical protein